MALEITKYEEAASAELDNHPSFFLVLLMIITAPIVLGLIIILVIPYRLLGLIGHISSTKQKFLSPQNEFNRKERRAG